MTRQPSERYEQILPKFRAVASSHARAFQEIKNHIRELLGPSQNYYSGLFREGILKQFLSDNLPRGVSVDTGFIYGFEKKPTSDQIDIIIWDSLRHAAVYRTRDFVLIPPEAAVAVLSVKSHLERRDIEGGLKNLLSVVPLDLAFRSTLIDKEGAPLCPPIGKFLVSFEGPPTNDAVLKIISQFFKRELEANAELAGTLVPVLRSLDRFKPDQRHVYALERVFPKLIVAIEPDQPSFLQGFGPPGELVPRTYGAGLRRLPYMYRQRNKLTSSFEKLIYYILAWVYRALGTTGWSVLSAWGDFDPILGYRLGDASEIVERGGAALLDPKRLPAAAMQPDTSTALNKDS